MGATRTRSNETIQHTLALIVLADFYSFHLTLIKFGLGANIGLKRTLNEFEMTMAIFLTDWTNQSKLTNSKSF